MFERFTDRAQRSVVLAQEAARELGHQHIGPEHILLGLIREGEGVAAKALTELSVNAEAIRQEVERTIGRGEEATSGHIPFTKEAKHTLELALREAIQLGHRYIGTEHILLGLIRDGDSVAAQALIAQGADLAKARRKVIQLLHGYQGREPTIRPRHLADIGRGMETIMERLAMIEMRLGLAGSGQPEALHQYNLRIARVRRAKESAIDAMNFARAAELRTEEKHLVRQRDAEEDRWLAESRERPARADLEDPAALRAEIARLRILLTEHGIDPGDSLDQHAAPSATGAGADDPAAGAGVRAGTEPGGPNGGPAASAPGGAEPGDPSDGTDGGPAASAPGGG